MGVQALCQFTLKCRKKALLGQNRRHLDLNSRSLPGARKPDREGHLMPDHVRHEMANKQVDQMQLKLASS